MAANHFFFESTDPPREKETCFARLREFTAAMGWSSLISNEVELILEEWWTNILSYGLTTQPAPFLRIQIHPDHETATIEIEDNGSPFDPTALDDPDVTLPLNERPIGGLGVFMIKKLSRTLRYERRDNLNWIVIQKSILHPVLAKPRR